MSVLLPHPPAGKRDDLMAEPQPARRTLRRIFEPIPRPAAYAAGLVLALAILAPFWLYVLQDSFQRRPILLSEDVESLPVPPALETNVATPVLDEYRQPSGIYLDQYRAIRLNASREEFQRGFSLRLLNTRGMAPEIYEATRAGEIEKVTMHFYNNALKEFWVVLAEKKATPEDLEKELRAEFGEPRQVADSSAGPGASGLGVGLAGPGALAKTPDEIEQKLAGFPFRRDLTWSDDKTRVRATIYHTSRDPAQCVSVVQVHVSAAAWLEQNLARVGSVVMPPAGLLEQTGTPEVVEPPKRLFP